MKGWIFFSVFFAFCASLRGQVVEIDDAVDERNFMPYELDAPRVDV